MSIEVPQVETNIQQGSSPGNDASFQCSAHEDALVLVEGIFLFVKVHIPRVALNFGLS